MTEKRTHFSADIDYVNGLKSLSGSRQLTPEASDFLFDAAEEMKRLRDHSQPASISTDDIRDAVKRGWDSAAGFLLVSRISEEVGRLFLGDHIPDPAQSKQVTIEVIASALRIALGSFERDICIDSLTENEIMHLARVAQAAPQPSPAATVETGRHISCAPGGKPYADSHNGSSADRETVAKIIYDAFPFEARIGQAQKPEWIPHGNSIRQDDARRAADIIRALPQTLPSREEIARILWERFAPVHHIGWADETHKAEYLAAADAVLSPLSRPQSRSGE